MPDEPEEEGFTFRDRRRSQSDDAPQASPIVLTPPPPPVTMADDEMLPEDEEAGPGEYTLPDVRDLLTEYLLVLRDVAVLRLGLAPNPGTNQMEPDLTQAKIAIDSIAFLSSQIEPFLQPEERLPLKSMIADLQLAYVRQSGG